MSFTSQSGTKRQSLQAAQIVPSPATSADTNGGTRRPDTSSLCSGTMPVGPLKLTPRSVDRTAAIWSTFARSDSNTL